MLKEPNEEDWYEVIERNVVTHLGEAHHTVTLLSLRILSTIHLEAKENDGHVLDLSESRHVVSDLGFPLLRYIKQTFRFVNAETDNDHGCIYVGKRKQSAACIAIWRWHFFEYELD